jgi:uncharacterized protein
MEYRIVRFQDCPMTAWKNGLGETTELAIEPSGVDYRQNNFVWRTSINTIGKTCAFSLFTGYERLSIQLDGGRAKLNHNDGAKWSVVSYNQCYFSLSLYLSISLSLSRL